MQDEKPKSDLRVVKTREAIRSALIELLSHKDLQDIRVREICDIARINRVTFYAHYKDIYDLVEQLCQPVADNLYQVMLDETRDPQLLLDQFEYFRNWLISMSNVDDKYPLPANFAHYLRTVDRLLNERLRTEENQLFGPSQKELAPFITEFCTAGLIGVYTKWYYSRRPLSFYHKLTYLFAHVFPEYMWVPEDLDQLADQDWVAPK